MTVGSAAYGRTHAISSTIRFARFIAFLPETGAPLPSVGEGIRSEGLRIPGVHGNDPACEDVRDGGGRNHP